MLYQHQATRRHSVAWQDSLRYRHPDLDRMPGLRRITICKNPLINDRGAELIAEALKDDLWVKGVFCISFVFFFSTISVVLRTCLAQLFQMVFEIFFLQAFSNCLF